MSLYDLSVPVFTRGVTSLGNLLDKAQAHAGTAGYDFANLLSSRLFPDMFPLSRQIQLTTDFAKGGVSRLAGQEVPRWDDPEPTLADLKARLARTLEYLGSFQPEAFAQAATRRVELKTPAGDFSFSGADFLQQWALPNFYFHLATAYNLLRHNGVPVGKLDFLGKL